MSFSRPSTPCSSISVQSVTNTDRSLYLYDHETLPCTPAGSMMPLVFSEPPLAPRPRKRVYLCPDMTALEDADLFMPTTEQLMGGRSSSPNVVEDDVDEDPLACFGLQTPPRKPSAVVPRLNRRQQRRKMARSESDTGADALNNDDVDVGNFDLRMAGAHDDEDDVVRIPYRFAMSDDELLDDGGVCDRTTSCLNMKLPPPPKARMSLKRRNSYNALCA